MRKINLLIFLLVLSIGSYAQSLRFTTSQYAIPAITDTAALHGGSISRTDSIYNPNVSSVVGPVSFVARVNSHICDTNQFVSTQFTGADTFYQNQRKEVSFTIFDSLPTGGGGFIIGPNTIVIWPVYNGGRIPGSDSVIISFNYIALGIDEAPLAHMFIFQNPGSLKISFGDAENRVQQVRIYDIIGKDIYSGTPDRSKNIPTEGWNKGIYLCEISTFSGEGRIFKFRVD